MPFKFWEEGGAGVGFGKNGNSYSKCIKYEEFLGEVKFWRILLHEYVWLVSWLVG